MRTQETGASPGYADTNFGLRSPRVAIVFPGETPNWHYFAHKALWQANNLWGGAGFVLVPHNAGQVSTTLLRAVAAYDPDYILTQSLTWQELVDYRPTALAMLTQDDGSPVTKEFLEGLLREIGSETAPDLATASARDLVASVCHGYRRREEAPDPPKVAGPDLPKWADSWLASDEVAKTLEESTVTPVSELGSAESMCVAVPADLGGSWGAMATALAGAVRPPIPPGSAERAAPLNSDDLRGLCSWFYSHLDERRPSFAAKPPHLMAHHPHDLALGVDMGALEPAWSRSTVGLVRVHDGWSGRRSTIVVGDTADDFALALIYDRVWGNALWIHSDWSPSAPGRLGETARSALRLLGFTLRQRGTAVITSASLGPQDLEDVRGLVSQTSSLLGSFGTDGESLASQDSAAPSVPALEEQGVSPAQHSNARGSDMGEAPSSEGAEGGAQYHSPAALTGGRTTWTAELQLPPRFDARGLTHLAISEDFSTRLTLPVLRDDDSTALSTIAPAFVPRHPTLASAKNLAWHVDVGIEGTSMPRGRGLDGHVLAASARDQWETWIRSGARSVSYESRKYDWVPAGANTEQRIARPRLRILTIRAWCQAMANQSGFDIGWSDAGRRAKLLERMWGDRESLTRDFTGTFVDLVELFNRSGKSSKDVYPDGSGAYIAGVGGFLTFDAIRDVLAPYPGRTPDGGASGQRGSGQGVSNPQSARERVGTEPVLAQGGWTDETPAAQIGTGLGVTPDGRAEQAAHLVERRNELTRRQLDWYLSRGIIRRGLLLGCGVCDQVNFIPVEDLGQRTECQRCGADTELTRDAWRHPSTEPTWFYDLHQVARTLVADHGHAPMWLAQHLAAKARNYTDCAELNLLVPGTRSSRAEVDLVAHVDGTLITAEVKTSNTLGNKAQRAAAAKKRVLWAGVLRADEILLATTRPAWESSSIDAVRRAMDEASTDGLFAPNHQPRLRIVTNLRGPDCRDIYED